MSQSNSSFHIFFRSIRHTIQPHWLVCLVLVMAACSGAGPMLDRPFFPEAYQIGSIEQADISEIPPSLYVIQLNHSDELNRRVLNFWRDGLFSQRFQKVQPLSTIYQEDISNLVSFLSQLFIIYLVAIDPEVPLSSGQLRDAMIQHIQCDPLTNAEIQFVMSSNLSVPFSRKPLTMLLISSHELALQSGAKAVYPPVFSPYLRKLNNLPPLKDLESSNLFATKNANRVYSGSLNGFIICNRTSNNHQSE